MEENIDRIIKSDKKKLIASYILYALIFLYLIYSIYILCYTCMKKFVVSSYDELERPYNFFILIFFSASLNLSKVLSTIVSIVFTAPFFALTLYLSFTISRNNIAYKKRGSLIAITSIATYLISVFILLIAFYIPYTIVSEPPSSSIQALLFINH